LPAVGWPPETVKDELDDQKVPENLQKTLSSPIRFMVCFNLLSGEGGGAIGVCLARNMRGIALRMSAVVPGDWHPLRCTSIFRPKSAQSCRNAPTKFIGAAKQPRAELGFSAMVRHDKPKNSIMQC